MSIDERILARRTLAAALAAACLGLTPSLVFAQDPPPPLAPGEPDAPPPAPPPAAPPAPPPAPEPPPRTDAVPAPLAPVPPAPTYVPPPIAPPYAPRFARPADHADAPRVLYGHAFITPALIDSPFVQSHVGIAAEVGRRWDYGVINSYPPPGGSMTTMNPDSFQFDQATNVAAQYLSFGVAVNDHVELGVSGSYAAQLSTDVTSAVQFGARSAWTLRPGARFQLSRSADTAVALHLYGDFGGDNQQSLPTLFAELAVEAGGIGGDTSMTRPNCLGAGDLSCALMNPGAVNTATTRTLAGGGLTLALAHAFSSMVGVQFATGLEAGYRSTNTSGSVAGSVPINYHLGVAPSVDFGPKVPLAIMAEYFFNVLGEPTTGDGDGSAIKVTNSLIAGVYYTGRRDLSVGALFNATFVYETVLYADGSTDLGPPVNIVTAQATARYFF